MPNRTLLQRVYYDYKYIALVIIIVFLNMYLYYESYAVVEVKTDVATVWKPHPTPVRYVEKEFNGDLILRYKDSTLSWLGFQPHYRVKRMLDDTIRDQEPEPEPDHEPELERKEALSTQGPATETTSTTEQHTDPSTTTIWSEGHKKQFSPRVVLRKNPSVILPNKGDIRSEIPICPVDPVLLRELAASGLCYIPPSPIQTPPSIDETPTSNSHFYENLLLGLQYALLGGMIIYATVAACVKCIDEGILEVGVD